MGGATMRRERAGGSGMTAVVPRRNEFPVARPRPALVAALSDRLAAWRYGGDRRDLRFDLLRGLAVVAMVADHIGGERSWLYTFTGGDRFWVSAAEGFVFISGLVMGIVYAGVLAREGRRAALLKVLRRAGTLYALTVGLTFATAATAARLGLPWAPRLEAGGVLDFAAGVLTLHRAYYLTDVLLLYTLLVFAAAPALLALAAGQTRPVLALSWALWALWQCRPDLADVPWAIANNETFKPAAWQLLFFNGLAIGYHRRALAPRWGWITGRRALLVSSLLFAGTILLYRAQLAPLSWLTGRDAAFFQAHLFAKADLRAGRLVAFAIVAIFALALVSNLWVPLRNATGWLLLPLGQDALLAYGLHLFVVAAATATAPRLFGTDERGAGQNAALQLGGLLAIWSMIVLRPRGLALAHRLGASRPTLLTRWASRHRATMCAPVRGSLAILLVGAGLGIAPSGEASQTSMTILSADLTGTVEYPLGRVVASPPVAPQPAFSQPIGLPAAPPRASEGASLPATPGEPASPTPARLVAGRFASATLGRTMPYLVFLPPGYDSSPADHYPVLYMLHGIVGEHTEWQAYGLLDEAERAMRGGPLAPFLIVLPQGDQDYWVDHVGGPQWAAYVARDVVDEIDLRYRTLPDRRRRAIGGLSMGAHGALQIALNHPHLFGVVGAHSPSFRDRAEVPDYFGADDDFARRDPRELVAARPEIARELTLWLDHGVEDEPFLRNQESFVRQLAEAGVPHQVRAWPGGHDSAYWSAHTADYLRFYGAALADK